MLMSGLFGEDLFDDMWGFPTHELANIDKRLYGKHGRNLMMTDVHETETDYELEMDLPGFKKDQINVKLEDGYMTISAAKDHDQEKKDIKAKFEDGVLKLSIPKKELKELPGNNTIAIEG